MLDLSVIMVSMDLWEEYTKPAIESVRKYLPDARLYVMDCGRFPYPVDKDIVRLAGSPSYAHALNYGVRVAGKADWYLMLNNDVMIYEPLDCTKLDTTSIYAKRILKQNGLEWCELWLALISQQVWDLVGTWDEKFLRCGFEDADYCARARELGIYVSPLVWNIKHFWGKTRWALPGYKKTRLDNLDYFEKKHGFRIENPEVVYG